MKTLQSWLKVSVVGATLLAGLVTGAGASPAQAAPSDSVAVASQSGLGCTVRIAKLRPGQTESDVVGSTCSSNANVVALSCPEPLATMYADINYLGNRLTYCGDYGTCDRAGYGFRDMGGFGYNTASSFKVYNGCNRAALYDLNDFRGDQMIYVGSRPWVGATMNDRTNSFRVWHL
ncbi:hypothetical protein AB0M20_02995 [Actinoplanes sp. NPDC051633]|uniref:hypothetical protein n=1 Tax=Actinoplanes sp. NPDC051633 TaxID=3155670 RepID=UPI00342157B1